MDRVPLLMCTDAQIGQLFRNSNAEKSHEIYSAIMKIANGEKQSDVAIALAFVLAEIASISGEDGGKILIAIASAVTLSTMYGLLESNDE
jgi:hypothetical protein